MITRRALLGAAAGTCWPRRECLVLEAIAAERMPQKMVVRGVEPAAFFELRDYGAAGDRAVEVLTERGIKPVLREQGRLLFAFESLVERERTWRELSADAEWTLISKSFALTELALYRASWHRGHLSPMRQLGAV